MKRLFLTNFAAALFAGIMIAGCASTATEAAKCTSAVKDNAPQKKLKVGYFVGLGSRGNGVFHWAKMLYSIPEIDVTLLVGKDIRNGALDGLDLLLIPGGSSMSQYNDITEAGGEKIREFVKNGGSYVGSCAGFHCTLNKPDRFRLLPYTYRQGAGGFRANVAINVNDRGAELLGIKGGRYYVKYSRGPISTEVREWEHGKAETLAIYHSTVSNIGKASDFMHAPAMVYGNYGKGKVIATSFHPEYHRGNDALSMGCIYAVTGVRPVPQYVEKSYRPVRVAFLSSANKGKTPIRQFIELDREKEIDVRLLSSDEIADGLLLHTDVVVISDDNADGKKKVIRGYQKDFNGFLARGGRIIICKKAADVFPEHKNITVIPSGASFVEEVLKRP